MNADAQNYKPWLHRFIVVTAVATFLLLGSGGMVTSHEAGMSVPDWPNTYGYNMFAFPFPKWVGGIFYEHTHRLLASGIGLLTTVLAVWLWLKDSRHWMRWLGVLAFVLVALQGLLGGLRVTLHLDKLGIVHGALAQLFFVLICALALFTSRFWQNLQTGRAGSPLPAAGAHGLSRHSHATAEVTRPTETALRTLVLATTVLIFLQLILGATMRHQHAGLAIPDFPTAYGKIWPDTGADAVARYNAQRVEVISENPITAFQIILQMAHRIAAVLILIAVAACAWLARVVGAPGTAPARTGDGLKNAEVVLSVPLRRLAYVWLALIVVQIILGAATIWTNKAADVATAHVLVGALALVTGALWCIIAFGPAVAALYGRRASVRQSQTAAPIGVHPAIVGNK